MLYTNEARELIANKVPWVKAKLYNYLTFQRLVEERLLPTVRYVERGQDLFDEAEVLKLIRKFPEEEPPRRIGIIRWLKGDRPKNERRAVKK